MGSLPQHDRDLKEYQSEPENPFIKFRRFADAQIGSLLHGIIGLPSAFSRTPLGSSQECSPETDLTWRDISQLRQHELEERQHARHAAEVEIPVKKSANRTWTPYWQTDSYATNRDIDSKLAKDLPLYSPVTKALFAHLQLPGDADVDWQQIDHSSKWTRDSILEFFPYILKKSQIMAGGHMQPRVSSSLKLSQYIVNNELNSSSILRSEYSLLPYLMFSPYSPIKLSQDAQQEKQNADFPYCDAFQDLIETSFSFPRRPRNQFSGTFFGFPSFVLGKSTRSLMAWVEELYHSGILQQRESRIAHHPFQVVPFTPNCSSLIDLSKPTLKNYTTEQDMSEVFLNLASSGVQRQFDGSLESFIGDTLKKLFGIASRSIDGHDDNQDEMKNTFSEASKEGKEDQENDFWFAKSGKPAAENIVVSSSTTTTRYVEVDGRVCTSVVMWKRLANGRETTSTTTSHEEKRSHHGDQSDENGFKEEEQTSSSSWQQFNEKDITAGGTKKGWFWK